MYDSQVQQGKDEVMLEFLPDTAAAEKEDALCEMTFYVPRENERYAGEDEVPASKVRLESDFDQMICPKLTRTSAMAVAVPQTFLARAVLLASRYTCTNVLDIPLQVFLDSVAALTGDAGDTTDPVATFDTVQVRKCFPALDCWDIGCCACF